MSNAIRKVSLNEKLAMFSEHWNPRVVAQVNDIHVKVVKLLGEFDWHHHETEDELFLVVKGRLLIQLRDQDVWLEPGECVVVPHGVEHRPVASEEVHLVLIEPAGTLNTGTVRNDRTVEQPQWI